MTGEANLLFSVLYVYTTLFFSFAENIKTLLEIHYIRILFLSLFKRFVYPSQYNIILQRKSSIEQSRFQVGSTKNV